MLFQLSEVRDHVAVLPGAEVNGQLSALSRAVLRVHTALAVSTPDTLDDAALAAFGAEIAAISELLSKSYLR